jgi:CheY-like chemotaxis protein
MVLVVEDDPLIQMLVEEQLTDGGFELAIATSGEETVTLLKGGDAKYRALVTDINLRGKIGGWEVGKQARKIDLAFPVIYMTATVADQWAFARRSQQHSFDQAVRTGPACHCHFSIAHSR